MSISKPVIKGLPYVDGVPDSEVEGQQRLQYMMNRDSLDAANVNPPQHEEDYGCLNKAPRQIQVNAKTLDDNVKAHQTTIETLVDSVNCLTGAGSADLGSRVTCNECNISTLQQNQTAITCTQGQLIARTDALECQQGTRDAADVINPTFCNDTIRQDLWSIKKNIIGNKAGFDPNGNADPTNFPTASGVSGEVSAVAERTDALEVMTSDHDSRLDTIESGAIQSDINLGEFKLLMTAAGQIVKTAAGGSTGLLDTESTGMSLTFTDAADSNSVHRLNLINSALSVTFDGTTHGVYHEGNKPTAADVGAITDAPNDGLAYVRSLQDWYPTPFFADVADDGEKYAKVNGGWAALGDVVELPNTVSVSNVIHFDNYDDDKIVLKDGTNYIISGVVDIGNRRFVMDSTTQSGGHRAAITAVNSATDHIQSSTTLPLFRTEDMSLAIRNISVSTQGKIFDVNDTSETHSLSLINFNVIGAEGLGTMTGFKNIVWDGFLITNLTGAVGQNHLEVAGNTDRLSVRNIRASEWDGYLLNFTGTIQNVAILLCDFVIDKLTQKIFGPATADSSIGGSATVEQVRVLRANALTQGEFVQASRANDFLGGVQKISSKWTITGGSNIMNTETFAVIEKHGTEAISVTDSAETKLFASTGALQASANNVSRFTYGDGSITYNGNDLGSREASLKITLKAADSASNHTLKFIVRVTDINGVASDVVQYREIEKGATQTISIDTPVTIGEGDILTCYTIVDATEPTTFSADVVNAVLYVR